MISAHAVFRFIYNAVYTFFYILLVALVVITPADVIYRASENGQQWNIWIVIAAYVITLLVVAFVYATRLYINKTALAAIPKQWIPIEKGDVHPAVYRLVQSGLDRSAAIAHEARPRIKTLLAPEQPEPEGAIQEEKSGIAKRASRRLTPRRSVTVDERNAVILPPHQPLWGDIEHAGWGSPASPDLADLEYSTVFLELPTLIEAKALTFAAEAASGQPALDPEATALLQRPTSMGLRDYIAHLSDLGVLPPSQTVTEFLASYENARYSTRPIPDVEFRRLMRLFAEVLRSMGPVEGSIYASSISSRTSFRSASPPGSSGSNGSHVRRRVLADTPDEWEFHTAPTTPKSAVDSSSDGFARTRRPYQPSTPSSSSLRSGSSGSVLRL
ncbi:related to thermatolerance membrane protein Dlt1 [Cephalotrichum gorgonifer]|uniref:Defect at low temperature protein 1 n=1 Tax=Cephalotrichum gorgonifer TaxID=2041049 RepID=A0AAE8N0S4_9PEZI|nr:related to thermatolerance membrane protein Dlt1 [Cephalotrichum gorgonifer]